MKKLLYILSAAVAVIIISASCSRVADNETAAKNPYAGAPVEFTLANELTRAPGVNYPLEKYLTQVDDQGNTLNRFEVIVYNDNGIITALGRYSYDKTSGKLVYIEGDKLYFPFDGSPIPSMRIVWQPKNSIHEIIADQTAEREFLLAEIFMCILENIMPTQNVMIDLSHVHLKYTFTLGGTLVGKKITSLEMNLYEQTTDSEPKHKIKTYCDPDPQITDAQYIWRTPIVVDSDSFKLITGVLTVEGEINPRPFKLNMPPNTLNEENNTLVTITF